MFEKTKIWLLKHRPRHLTMKLLDATVFSASLLSPFTLTIAGIYHFISRKHNKRYRGIIAADPVLSAAQRPKIDVMTSKGETVQVELEVTAEKLLSNLGWINKHNVQDLSLGQLQHNKKILEAMIGYKEKSFNALKNAGGIKGLHEGDKEFEAFVRNKLENRKETLVELRQKLALIDFAIAAKDIKVDKHGKHSTDAELEGYHMRLKAERKKQEQAADDELSKFQP